MSDTTFINNYTHIFCPSCPAVKIVAQLVIFLHFLQSSLCNYMYRDSLLSKYSYGYLSMGSGWGWGVCVSLILFGIIFYDMKCEMFRLLINSLANSSTQLIVHKGQYVYYGMRYLILYDYYSF